MGLFKLGTRPNLIAQPDAQDTEVKFAVNNMLKAITASLLMEQILAPNFKFKTKRDDEDIVPSGTLTIKGFKEPSTAKTKAIIENGCCFKKYADIK